MFSNVFFYRVSLFRDRAKKFHIKWDFYTHCPIKSSPFFLTSSLLLLTSIQNVKVLVFFSRSTLLYIKCGARRDVAVGVGRTVAVVTVSHWSAVSINAVITSTMSTTVGAAGLLGPFPTISSYIVNIIRLPIITISCYLLTSFS